MTDPELDHLLRSSQVPHLPSEYWKQFPARVMQETRRRAVSPSNSRAKSQDQLWPLSLALLLNRKAAFTLGMVIFCACLASVLVNRHQKPSADQKQLAEVRKYYQEIEALFPNQMQAIVFDAKGPKLVLADRPTVAAIEPLYLKLCNAHGCCRYVTFSGQRIKFSGQDFEVLSSRQGEVFLVGEQSVWSSASSPQRGAALRIEAHPLAPS